MAAVACPFRPVPQRDRRDEAVPFHVCQFLAETATDDPLILVVDCACGARKRVRTTLTGQISEELPEALVFGGSLANVIFTRREDGSFADRWQPHGPRA